MSHLTEQAIQATFIRLLNERPLDKITVRDLADECGISRNTFYYHYHDIYELLEKMFEGEKERMLQDMQDISTIRMNIDNFDEAYNMLLEKGFKNSQGDKVTETPSSKSTMMFAPSGFPINITQHIKKDS